ncbi:PAP2 family protein [Leptotrichia sp. oral taxon 215 str. W9775]|uniref:phosphatase PAP2 family protein n=1 Tax=Leptotrichia sp. oral taxon 215 TaxID=712359 RepID=UPI0003ADEED2|nr:phosphatase PAP2 family protein [Leptotrichia sp. oral taxon 215]ERK67801.1 PAP2 family protein [Leptotrichia sp. oral taxon 215 str. W9775]
MIQLKLTNYIFSIDKFFFKHLSYISDSSIFRHSESIERFFRFITKFGEGYFELLLTIVLLSLFLSNKQKYNFLKKYILAIIFTLLSTQITVNIMKVLFARARPSITINPDKFYGIMTMIKDSSFWKGSYVSFPSGHTITIWGTIWILSFYIKNKFIRTILFVLGVLVGMSRVYLVRHWTTDVVASVILSYFIAKIIYKKINLQWYKINYLKNIIFNIKYKKRKLEVIN